jgi:hypothetical protein
MAHFSRLFFLPISLILSREPKKVDYYEGHELKISSLLIASLLRQAVTLYLYFLFELFAN